MSSSVSYLLVTFIPCISSTVGVHHWFPSSGQPDGLGLQPPETPTSLKPPGEQRLGTTSVLDSPSPYFIHTSVQEKRM